jgi:cell filamentation protein
VSDDPYVYPGTDTLINCLNIRDPDQLDEAERALVHQRMREGSPRGAFDLDHLRAIHYHLFQDVYPWAGEIRTVPLWKGDTMFQWAEIIEADMKRLHMGLEADAYLRGLDQEAFCPKAARLISELNLVHPFREGNGRTQLQYFEQLADQAGHPIELETIARGEWIDASIAAYRQDRGPMERIIASACVEHESEPSRTAGREEIEHERG